ncbi:SMI1/KNR4 family protein [Hymenobacter terricola]|uniref:hypothetical protein n=1 Tax=Hymenobacter terricola TaxID=2819236 RepID=UPI001B30C6D4|nr:hypothetical protein [Hymenobacter terricola]
MQDFNNKLAEVLSVLSQFWLNQSIVSPASELQYVRAVSQEKGIKLPADFEQFYCSLNGMPAIAPHDMDSEGYAFWPIEQLRPVQKEWVVITAEAATVEFATAVIFVDYLISCWEYGFMPNESGEGYRIGILASGNEFKVISASLVEFLNLYMLDADVLYDWKNPFA